MSCKPMKELIFYPQTRVESMVSGFTSFGSLHASFSNRRFRCRKCVTNALINKQTKNETAKQRQKKKKRRKKKRRKKDGKIKES